MPSRDEDKPSSEEAGGDGTAAAPGPDEKRQEGPPALADRLGVSELDEIVFFEDGRLFSAAGRLAPIAELAENQDLVLRPPGKPLIDSEPVESITIQIDGEGILLNELGERRRIAGARFRGRAIYLLGETSPGTSRHLAGCFDQAGRIHKLYLNGQPITGEIVYKLRMRTHDGELSVFAELAEHPGQPESQNGAAGAAAR